MGISNTNLIDYRAVDGTETVTLRDMSAGTDNTITYACREPISLNEAMGLGIFRNEATVWHLADTLIPSANKPEPGDKITDASSVVWYVLEATKDEIGVSWRCVTKKGR